MLVYPKDWVIPLSDAAKADIHRHADGIPRIVNTVCYRSLINAAVMKLKIIDSADLFLEDPASAES